MYIPIILGTGRSGRQSEKAARFMHNEAIKAGLETEIIDVQNYLIGVTDNTKSQLQAKELSKRIALADGIIIVSPEYNHGYPGELKIMIDMVREEYARKPVGFCGVSAGPFGGSRAVEQLRLVMIELCMVPIREAIYFTDAQDLFDENWKIKDNLYYDRARVFFEELLWYAKALKPCREQNIKKTAKQFKLK